MFGNSDLEFKLFAASYTILRNFSKVIIVKSDLFHHDLTLQFGVLSSYCKNEYLEKSLSMIAEWETDIELAVDEIFFDNIPEINKFKLMLGELKESIKNVQKIPIEKRIFEEW